MTAYEIVETILQIRKERKDDIMLDEAAINELSELVCGSFIYQLYENLWQNFLDVEVITDHLKYLYENDKHFGLVYFILLLAEAIDYVIPHEYIKMSTINLHIPILSDAVISDWLYYHENCVVEGIEAEY